MNRPPQAKWAGNGIVEAPVERVWEALLDVSLEISPVDWQTLALENGPLRFTTTMGEPPIGNMHVEIDQQQHSIAIEGEWWYRGVRSIESHMRGSLLSYRVYNIAPVATRWLVPLIQCQFNARMKADLQQLLSTLGDHLNCTIVMEGSSST